MKEILIFAGGSMFGGLVAFVVFCFFSGIRMKNEKSSNADKGEEIDRSNG